MIQTFGAFAPTVITLHAAMNDAHAAALPEGGRPVRTCIGVTALVRGALIDVEAIARRP